MFVTLNKFHSLARSEFRGDGIEHVSPQLVTMMSPSLQQQLLLLLSNKYKVCCLTSKSLEKKKKKKKRDYCHTRQ